MFHPVDTDFGAADGVYWWRVVSVDADGPARRLGRRAGASCCARRRARRSAASARTARAIELDWGGSPEDREEVELARDAAFQQIVARGDFDAPGGTLRAPGRRHVLRALPLRRARRLQDRVERHA